MQKKSIKEIDIDKLNKKDKNEINELKDIIQLGLSKTEAENKTEENINNQEASNTIVTNESSEDNNLYVCENCDKTSNEHNFVAGKNVCNDCFEILSQEIITAQ